MSDDQFLEAVKWINAPVVYPYIILNLTEYLEKAAGDKVKLIYK